MVVWYFRWNLESGPTLLIIDFAIITSYSPESAKGFFNSDKAVFSVKFSSSEPISPSFVY